jgi:hypothetical protein
MAMPDLRLRNGRRVVDAVAGHGDETAAIRANEEVCVGPIRPGHQL